MKKTKLGFSLIELIIVIAIIAILASLIAVGTSRLRADGRRTKCINTLRAYGAELNSYLATNQDRFPTETDIDNPCAWFNILPERIKRPRMADLVPPQQEPTDFPVRIPSDEDFICPEMTYERAPNQKYYCSYAINADLVAMGRKAKQQNIKHPEFFIFLCETPTPNNPKIDLDTIKKTNPVIAYRHRESLVACFADGHAGPVTKVDMEEDNSRYKWNYNEATEAPNGK